MKNAHLRFGHLIYTKVLKKTTTQFKVPLDRFIGETDTGSQTKAHLISVIGGDTQIAALSAAIVNRDLFTVEGSDRTTCRVSLGANAECYRGSLQLEGQKRPLRHLVAVSEELAQIAMAKNADRAILIDSSPEFIWASVAYLHGVPGAEGWAEWITEELQRMKVIQPLLGIGCSPVLIKGTKGTFMNCVSRGLRENKLRFPDSNGPLNWNRISLPSVFDPKKA